VPARTIDVGALLHALDGGAPWVLLDVRNDAEVAAWQVEARRPVDRLHVPYFAFLDEPATIFPRLPRDREIAVVCAKGGASAMVADVLCDAGFRACTVDGGMAAYGDHLEPVRLAIAPPLAIWQLLRRGKGCLSYVVAAGGEALIVDPSRHVERYEALAREHGLRIVHVVDTHVHADHVSGARSLAARSGAVYRVDAGPGVVLGHPATTPRDGECLRLGDVEVRALAAPGHTPGSWAYLVDERYLLSGDTLFVRGVGRPDLGGQTEAWARDLFRTLHARLASLSDDTVILPAHFAGAEEIGDDGTVGVRLGALRGTPAFRLDSEGAFVAAISAAVTPAPAAYAEIVRTNLGVAGTSDEERIAEWELGPNHCAARPRTT